jgi:hypothetical protein
MAVLSSNTLDDCLYIPDFISAGTRMIFENASAPVSWTKDTVPSTTGIALRVVTGTVTPRTATPYAQVLTAKQQVATVTPATITVNTSINTAGSGINPQQVRGAFNTSANLNSIHAHSHGLYQCNAITACRNSPGPQAVNQDVANILSNASGGSAQHSHTVNVTAHGHAINSQHSHTVGGVAHGHSQSPVPSENFSVFYRDMIICVKD